MTQPTAPKPPDPPDDPKAKAKRRLKERIEIELQTLDSESIVERGLKIAHDDFPELTEEDVDEVREIVVRERNQPDEFTTDVLTFPEEKLSPEAALRWIDVEYAALEEALSCGFIAESDDARMAFSFLSMDLARLHAAAVTTLKTHEPVVLRCIGPDHGDFEEHTQLLARVVAQSHLEEQSDSPAGQGFRRLGELLVARLEAEEESDDDQ